MTIWFDGTFQGESLRQLEEGAAGHRLIRASAGGASLLAAARRDPALAQSEIAFGQPHPADCLDSTTLRWIEVSTAGYTRYDAEFREEMRKRGVAFTNASDVFADACAQHVLAFMLALARDLPASHREQLGARGWPYDERRAQSRLLTGQTLVMLGYGAIGRRLNELLAPFRMRLFALRRSVHSEAGVRIVPESELTGILPLADHVVNILPDSETTRNYVNARRIGCFKAGARFYNVGRGSTVDQTALLEALTSGRIGAACLDVTDPEPLPPQHPLWTARNCLITPHSAGGRHDQEAALVRHFVSNLAAFETGGPMTDRIL